MYATDLHGDDALGMPTLRDIADLPHGAADLLVVCTPAASPHAHRKR